MTAVMRAAVLRSGRLGSTDVFHDRAAARGTLGYLYLFLFGTPHLSTFASGYYLRRAMAGRKFNSILDAGCGDGTFSFYVASRMPGARVLGVDIGEQGAHTSETTLDLCSRIQKSLPLPNLRFERTDLRELSATEEFDFVYSFDVLEHIAENKLVMERIYQALVPGGIFLVRMPTLEQKRILRKKYTADHAHWASLEHLGQHYDMQGLIADLKSIGYEIIDARFTAAFWGKLAFEIPEALRYYRVPEPILFAIMPLCKLLRWFDVWGRHKDGNGLIVIGRKSPNPA